MKSMIRSVALAVSLSAVAFAYGEIPKLNVTVSDSSGKAAFKGATASNGTFSTSTLKPGNYVVQFNATGQMPKGNQYGLVVSAGKKKVAAQAVPGEKFKGGGVAMKVEVGNGLNITGQVSSDTAPVSKTGKKMVWIPRQLGSNTPGHWAEEGSAEAMEAKTAGSMSRDDLQNRQNHGDSGLLGR